MKKEFNLFSIALVLFFTFSFSIVSQKNTVNIKIDGMMCQKGCAMYIESELEKMKGVVEASIDFNQSEGEIVLRKRTSKTDVVSFINNLKGGSYKAFLIDNTTNQINLNQGSKVCSKGKSCCQKTGQKVVACDNKSKGCCSGAVKKVVKKDNSISEMTPGHTGCQKACCAKK